MHSIRYKIMIITVAAILTTILAVFVVCYPTVKLENERSSALMMNLIADDTCKALEKYIENIERSVEQTANIATDTLDSIVLVENGIAGPDESQYKQTDEQENNLDIYLSGYCDLVQEAFSSIANHTTGIVTYYYCIRPEISQTRHGFFYSKVGRTGFAVREPLDARKLDPEDIEHTTWYYTPIERGRPSWVGPYTAHFLDEIWICSYLVPIYRTGALIGVLGMDIPCETLFAQLSPIRVYNTGYACLLDENGRVIYHPVLPIGSEPGIDGVSIPDVILAQDNNGEELIRYSADGQKRQMAFTTLSNGMKLIVTAPETEIQAAWMKLVNLIVIITLVIIVFFILLLLFVMNYITRPLQLLTSASRKLAAADYDVELNYSGKDEVGVLTASFQQMRDQLKLHIEDLNRRINTDSLTGISNMKHFCYLSEMYNQKLLSEGKNPAMLFFDLLGMKHYNRQYGLPEGDRLLCDVANLLALQYGEQCVGRFGQDHFVAVTEETTVESDLEKFFEACSRANGGRSLSVRAGIYLDSIEHVSANVAADRAKYACDQYRGSYVSGFYYFDSAMLREAENVRYLIGNLDRALAEHWVSVYYQPIIRTSTGRICDEESLARWNDPEKGLLSPADFIPILETARLIYKLDLYMLEQTLQTMKQQIEKGIPMIPRSINLSRSDFDSCDIVEEIRTRVDEAGIARDTITIEITESIIGSDFDFMKEQVQRFRNLGFPVWMDDFGSGYSSLDVLQSIRFDTIKFDMSFMQLLDEGEGGKIILTHLMNMCKDLGVETVCEGVETEAQVEFLREIGCTRLQGYYFSKPLPAEELQKIAGTQLKYESPVPGGPQFS